MASYITTDTELQSVANAIRSKGNTSEQLSYPTGFVSAISALPNPVTIALPDSLSVIAHTNLSMPPEPPEDPDTVVIRGFYSVSLNQARAYVLLARRYIIDENGHFTEGSVHAASIRYQNGAWTIGANYNNENAGISFSGNVMYVSPKGGADQTIAIRTTLLYALYVA